MQRSFFPLASQPVAMFLFCMLLMFFSCKKKIDKEEALNNSKFFVEKTTVKTLEVIKLKSKAALQERYNASFGSVSIQVLKLTDSTVAFIVPEVVSGEYTLRFDSAAIKFNVIKATGMNPDQLVTAAFKNFDTYISTIKLTSAKDTAYVESIKQNREKIINMFNSLTAEQKRLTAIFYEANEDLLKEFNEKTPAVLNGNIGLRPINVLECANATNNYKAYGICIADVLNPLLYVLNEGLDAALITIKHRGVATDYELPFLSALYLRIFEKQRILFFQYQVQNYLYMNWIFDDRLFDNIITVYPDEEFIDLNINAGFRPLNPNKDEGIDPEVRLFIERMNDLRSKWNLLPFLGYFPDYQYSFESLELNTSDITITQISNSKVIIGDRSGERIKFNTTSDQSESFSYEIKAQKQGFFSSTTVYGRVNPVSELERYRASIIGNWRIDSYDRNGVLYYVQHKTLAADGNVYIRINMPVGEPPIYYNPPIYQERWSVVQDATGYHLAINGQVYPYVLTLPVTFIDGGLPPYPNYRYEKE